MALSPGQLLGPYEIVALVGTGGMGEVYRARDTRLGRTVALKVIGSGHNRHPDVRRRFETEARLAAQLDHPRIGAVFDVGHDHDVDYFVMEFVEGSTLAVRIGGKPLRLTELIGYAIEIAAALAYAHARGVEHRDLKPGNVLVTPSGIKVIDFGIARRRWREQRPSDDLAAMKTSPLEPVEAAPAAGTIAYLAPERLHGQPSDHRSDIFAFGTVLYEMATGRRAFDGDTPAAIAAAVLTAEPPVLVRDEPGIGEIDWVMRRCLKKDPAERWQSMADVETVLKRIAMTSARPRLGRERDGISIGRRGLVLAILVLAAAGFTFAWAQREPAPAVASRSPIAFAIPPPAAGRFTLTGSVQSPQLAVSPDGQFVAFVATAGHVSQIWLRPIASSIARPIPGTEDAVFPFWSASSQSIGFFSGSEMKRIDIDGGPVRSLSAARAGRGGAWSTDGTILFAPNTEGAIYRLGGDGGVEQQTVLSTDRRETSHRWPQFLPDGRHFIYFAKSADDSHSGIRFASIDAPGDAVVVRTGYGAVYTPSGHLLYVSDDALLAASFDVAQGRLVGDPVTLIDQVSTSSNFYGAFSASNNGVLAYATTASAAQLTWMGRDGQRLGVAAGPGRYVDFQLSPNGRFLAVAEVEPRSDRSDLRLVDLTRGTNLRLTASPATDASAIWSPDSTRLVFRSNRERQHDLYLRQAAGGGEDELFLKSPAAKYPTDWSPDGAFVIYHAFDDRTHQDVWVAPVGRPNDSRPLLQTEVDEVQAQISPSGRWLAYTANDSSSRFEVYVQPMPPDGRKWQISTDGGSDPKWRSDEKEIFYVRGDGRLMSVALTATGIVLEPGIPRPLFPLGDGVVGSPYLSAYDVEGDGQRFLVRAATEQLETHPLNVIVNWSVPVRATK